MFIIEMNLFHIPQVAEIERQSFSKPWSEQSITESFNQKCNHFFVSVIDSKVVGYIGITVTVDEAYILNVAVLPEYRGQGIGDKLVDKVLDYGSKNNLQFVTLEVRPSNTPAVNLYTHKGFTEVGRRKNYYSNPIEDALLLTKFYNS